MTSLISRVPRRTGGGALFLRPDNVGPIHRPVLPLLDRLEAAAAVAAAAEGCGHGEGGERSSCGGERASNGRLARRLLAHPLARRCARVGRHRHQPRAWRGPCGRLLVERRQDEGGDGVRRDGQPLCAQAGLDVEEREGERLVAAVHRDDAHAAAGRRKGERGELRLPRDVRAGAQLALDFAAAAGRGERADGEGEREAARVSELERECLRGVAASDARQRLRHGVLASRIEADRRPAGRHPGEALVGGGRDEEGARGRALAAGGAGGRVAPLPLLVGRVGARVDVDARALSVGGDVEAKVCAGDGEHAARVEGEGLEGGAFAGREDHRLAVFEVVLPRRLLLLDGVVDADPDRPARQVAREVAHVVVRGLHHDRVARLLLLVRVGDEVGVASVAEVVRAAGGVEDQVPVDPADRPVEQVLQDVHPEVLGPLPPLGGRLRLVDDSGAVARLGGEQELVRRERVRPVEVVCVEPSVPVHADPVEVVGGRRVRVEAARVGEDVVLVVVEADDLDARVLLAQHGAEVLLDEGGHVVGRVDTLLPADVRRLGLVLDRHAPDVDAARRVPREEAREVVRVRPLLRRVEAVWLRRPNHRLHAADRQLHPRWRRPGRRHQGEAVGRPALELRHRRVDHRDDAVVDVVLHRVVKVMQVRVARLLCE
mmetsp:Transcript_2908/g.9534  ORF Transcript_2908/g.9534 Transcript_2908/m.9534 type:complete len:658 (+) Transcript_2908:183-2156(+)